MKKKEVLKNVLFECVARKFCDEDIGKIFLDSLLTIDYLGTPYNE